MKSDTSEWLETRASLLARIRNPEDHAGWREFDRIYRRLLWGVARRWGLNETEAEDVAQDTMVSVLKSMPGFEYRPETCSFKSWLRRLTESRIVDFLRRRQSAEGGRRGVGGRSANERAVAEMADPHGLDLEAVWEAEWRQAVVELALVKLRCRVRPQPYQIFYLLAVKEQSPREVARRLAVSRARVYLTRFRVAPIFARCLTEAQRQIEIGEGMAGGSLTGRSPEG
jgi:RNA polymerase sigma-70 factor (ECF subfamily)